MNLKRLFKSQAFAKGLKLRNSIIMAPMTTWSANHDLTVSDEEVRYFERRSQDVGLVLTGCSHVSANGIGFTDEFAAFDDRFIPGLTKLASAAKSGGAPAILQLFHAGNKAVADLIEQGDVVSASAVPSSSDPFSAQQLPRALTEQEIQQLIVDFGQATRRAIEAGFDGVELHGAHGFLLQNFFSPYFNRRDDRWGGSLENRLRFPLAVVEEVQRIVAEYADRPFVVGFRISPEESQDGGLKIDDFKPLIDHLIEGGLDYLHISQPGGILKTHPSIAPQGPVITALLVTYINHRLPVIAAGGIRTPEQAEQALALGIDLVAVGQGLVIDPDWVKKVAQGEAFLTDLGEGDAIARSIPSHMWQAIKTTPGWFNLRKE
ncbi:NADH-dependent flavin oxidoreductase [Celerinatantimonas sp. YJH-8]|uniref:NADH-dependent flavin oxidoreductase n=1 Tax=Celerinatantimonas sp. YJH-8 TaxID=3228714 RepID=UPI0038BE8F44